MTVQLPVNGSATYVESGSHDDLMQDNVRLLPLCQLYSTLPQYFSFDEVAAHRSWSFVALVPFTG